MAVTVALEIDATFQFSATPAVFERTGRAVLASPHEDGSLSPVISRSFIRQLAADAVATPTYCTSCYRLRRSATLAGLVNELNQTQPIHILTLEDPIELLHPQDGRP
jgi:hypothetical protein